ncbi:hypothetical protein LCGC14_1125520, partial [marine sediment metagenome]
EIDTREKCPIKFPTHIKVVHPERRMQRITIGVKTRRIHLDCGDYRLAEYPTDCVIERKGGQREIAKNVFNPKDMVRQAKAFRKLVGGCKYPYLLIEVSPSNFMRKTQYVPDTEALINRFSMAMVKYGFHVMWVPWRSSRKSTGTRQLGTLVLHTMLACGLNQEWDILPDVMEVK